MGSFLSGLARGTGLWWYFAGMETPRQVKRSIYLDRDVDEALKQSAHESHRSVTKQLNLLLRNGLGVQQGFRHVTHHHPGRPLVEVLGSHMLAPTAPDPKIKSKKPVK